MPRYIRSAIRFSASLFCGAPVHRAMFACVGLLLFSAPGAEAAGPPPLMTLPGQFSVNSTGAATYSIPVSVPPGSAGLVPALSLDYSSQGSDGIVGLAWALNGLPSITRCPRTIAQDNGVHGGVNYDGNDRFCMDGQRLMVVGGSYGADGSEYRTEIESFSRIVAHGSAGAGPAWFEVWTKAGQHMEFGHSSDSQVLVVSAGGSVTATAREWAINKISDAVGNYLTVTYNCAPSGSTCTDVDRVVNGEVYPLRVDYTGNAAAGVSPYNSVQFSYASRSDWAPFYQAGGVSKTTVVLTNIKTYQGSTLVSDYRLAYRAGSSTLHSRLTSITQCAGDGTCLPPTTFGWQGGAGPLNYSNAPTPITITSDSQVVAADFNGDGLTDLAAILYGGDYPGSCPPFPVYLGQQSFGFNYSSDYALTNGAANAGAQWCFVYLYNTILAPDGTSDILMSVVAGRDQNPQPSPNRFASLLTSAGNINLSTYTGGSLPIATGDYNGDGIADFVSPDSDSSNQFVYFGTTSGSFNIGPPLAVYTQDTVDFDGDGCTDAMGYLVSSVEYFCNPAVSSITAPFAIGPKNYGDFNGDGKTDVIQRDANSGALVLWLSTGTGFQQFSLSLPNGAVVYAVGDWNGDGKADIVAQDPSSLITYVYISTGTDFVHAVDGSGNPITVGGSDPAPTIMAADWNNDGASDLLQTNTFDGTFTLFSYVPELMTSVSNGIGAETIIAYDRINKGGSFYNKGQTASYPTQNIIGPQYVVSEVDTSDGLGTCTSLGSAHCYRTIYAYSGALKDLTGRGFLGFSQVVMANPQTNIVQTTNYSLTFPYIGQVTSQTKVHTGTTISSTSNTYNNNSGCGATPAGSGVYVDCLTHTVISSNDLNGAPFPTTTTDYTYDNYGNALTANVAVSDGSSKNTTNTYLNDTMNWFLGRLLTTSVHSVVSGSSMTRQSSFAYDASRGLLTQEAIEPGVSTCNNDSSTCTLTTSYTYDAFGHRITTTVFGTGIVTRTSYAFYDGYGRFETSAANALGQYEFWTYDARFGGPTSHTGPNFLTTNWSYDIFGRVTRETRPNGTQTAQSYGYCVGSCPTYGRFYVQSQVFAPNGSTQIGPIGTLYYDMLSRGIASDTQGFDGSNVRVATVYDANGRVQETSRPYFSGGAPPAWTQYSYDDLGRVTQATFPDTSHTTYGYNGLITSTTNNLDQTTTTTKNAQGLNYQITDATSHTTTYIYDAFGDPLTVTDPLGNVTANYYDIRGNKVLSRTPDMGTWTYSYDVLSELIAQTDAKSQSTVLSYDVLGRSLTRIEPGLYSAWTYGTSAGARNIGQLTEAQACVAQGCAALVSDKTFTFDDLGRPSQTQIHTATDGYGFTTTYNVTNGQIASVTYPSGLMVSRTYNAWGYLTNLTDGNDAPIWMANARDAEMHLTSQTAGNGVLTTQQFNPATGLIQNQRAGGGSVASFDYAFDTLGNLTVRTDSTQNYTERFCYDGLNRLVNYNLGTVCTGGKTISYDTIGNITAKSDTGAYAYGGTGPHAVSAITGTVDGLVNPRYSYDADGNLSCVSSGTGCSGTLGRTIVSTSFNMAAQMIQGQSSLELTYDDQHHRIQQVNTVSDTATTTTVYLNDPSSGAMSERVSNATTIPSLWNSFNWGDAPWGGATPNTLPTWTDYISVDGQIIAQHTIKYPLENAWGFHNWGSFNWGPPPGTKWGQFSWGAANWSGPVVTWAYFNLDHLGSVAVITDQGGNVVQRLSYDAWGKVRNANGTDVACGTITAITTRGFTNQEQMPTACLLNLNARLYDPSIGKFIAADTMVPNSFDGQTYNRYAYVTNNPLSLTDPTGHDVEDAGTVTGLADPGYSLSAGAALLGSSGFGDADPASPHGTPARPQSTRSQQDQTSGKIEKTYRPPNLCSRAGGGSNSVCGGGYANIVTVFFNSSGESTASHSQTEGHNDSGNDTNGGFQQVAQSTYSAPHDNGDCALYGCDDVKGKSSDPHVSVGGTYGDLLGGTASCSSDRSCYVGGGLVFGESAKARSRLDTDASKDIFSHTFGTDPTGAVVNLDATIGYGGWGFNVDIFANKNGLSITGGPAPATGISGGATAGYRTKPGD